jgi:hypothetical protein
MDAAYTGRTGLAVIALEPELPATARPAVWSGDARSVECFRWLGSEVAKRTKAGERAQLIVESDAFGPSVARKLGIAIGNIEGLLVDLNATPPGTRVDVASATWRRVVLGKSLPKGRKALKDAARAHVSMRWGLDLDADAAEALCILEWGLAKFKRGDLLSKEDE